MFPYNVDVVWHIYQQETAPSHASRQIMWSLPSFKPPPPPMFVAHYRLTDLVDNTRNAPGVFQAEEGTVLLSLNDHHCELPTYFVSHFICRTCLRSTSVVLSSPHTIQLIYWNGSNPGNTVKWDFDTCRIQVYTAFGIVCVAFVTVGSDLRTFSCLRWYLSNY